MSNPTTEKTEQVSARSGRGQNHEVSTTESSGALASKHGSTTISDTVVQKIASMAAREVAGVASLGGSVGRAFGAIRERIPGAQSSSGQGVTVEVGERQAAVDLDLLVDYGVAIPDLARAVRKNVISGIEQMTGLDVVEVNINVNDVYLGEGDEHTGSQHTARVE
ncbi:MAG: Asp23/Gls24 family envelope stress response protein [Sciscionella sp.]